MDSKLFQTLFGCCLGQRRREPDEERRPLIGGESDGYREPNQLQYTPATEEERVNLLNQRVSTIAQNAADQMLNTSVNRTHLMNGPLSNNSSSHVHRVAPHHTQQNNPGTGESSRQSSYKRGLPTALDPDTQQHPSTEHFTANEAPASDAGTDGASAIVDSGVRPSRPGPSMGSSRRLVVHRGRPPPRKRPSTGGDERMNGIATQNDDNRPSSTGLAALPSSPPIPVAAGPPTPRGAAENSNGVHYQRPEQSPLIIDYD